ncbi:hypothetical protein [uncultured Desulfosarcina sp.]|uniref:hypothetical protein n=1 Tax=uncultured Desulfosarcina sp. TaxID=218289 RepID=UPI0029C73F9D|nr:hypothetical protein [uncultured Desulfosarcina sp.]
MQGKRRPGDSDVKVRFELFNTPGTEVAPGSDVVGEDFQYRIFHYLTAFLSGFPKKLRKNQVRFRVIFCGLVSSGA